MLIAHSDIQVILALYLTHIVACHAMNNEHIMALIMWKLFKMLGDIVRWRSYESNIL